MTSPLTPVSHADVIGVCKSVDEVTRLTTKTSREVSKRTLNLMDMSGKVVSVTLWGEEVRMDISLTHTHTHKLTHTHSRLVSL